VIDLHMECVGKKTTGHTYNIWKCFCSSLSYCSDFSFSTFVYCIVCDFLVQLHYPVLTVNLFCFNGSDRKKFFLVKCRDCSAFLTHSVFANVYNVIVITCMTAISKLDLMIVSIDHLHIRLSCGTLCV